MIRSSSCSVFVALPMGLVMATLLLLPMRVCAANTYTMEEAVSRALTANPNVEGARHGVEASESALKAARSSFGPSVDGSYNFTYYDEERQARNDKRSYAMGVGLTQPLFTGFNLLNSYQKAVLQKESQELQLQHSRLMVVEQVQAQFLNYLRAEENIRSAMRSMERAREQMATAEAAFNIGLRPRLDVAQATLDLTRSEALLIQSENDRDLRRAELNTLMNLNVDHESVFVGELLLLPFDMSLEACLERAFRQRPDLLVAVKAVEIAYEDLGIAKSSFYPQINAAVEWSSMGDDFAAAGSRRLSQDYSTWTAGINLQWNLFSSGKHLFTTQQAKSQIASLESQLQSSFNDAALEIKSCLVNAQDAKRSVAVAERAVASATESYNDAKMRYELQLGTNLDLLTAQADLSSAELSLISAKADYMAALARLYVAMGEINPGLDIADNEFVSGSLGGGVSQ